MRRRPTVELALLVAVLAAPALADVPARVPVERVPDLIDSPEFIMWLPLERTADQAEVLVALGWRAPDDCLVLRLTGAVTELHRVTADGVTVVARRAFALPPVGRACELTIRRRSAEIIASIGDTTLLHCLVEEPLDGKAGAWATCGARLEEMMVQPLSDIRLNEDFFQVEDVPGRWETLRGDWRVRVYWDPLQERDHRPIGSSWYEPGEGECLTAVGYDFWDCYRIEATVRLEGGSGGLAPHALGPDDWCAFVLDTGAGEARLERIAHGTREVLGRAPMAPAPGQWYRLAAQVSTGLIECAVNGEPVVAARVPEGLTGRVGLCATDAAGSRFDDVMVRPLHVAGIPAFATAAETCEFRGGTWTIEDGVLRGHVPGAQVAALRAGPFGDCRVSARVTATRNATAGLVAHHAFGDRGLLFTLTAADAPTWHVHSVIGGETRKLGEGPAPAAEGTMGLTLVGGRIECTLDGAPVYSTWALGIAPGRAGVYVGGGRAAFEHVRCVEIGREPQAVICDADGTGETVPALEEKHMLRLVGDLWRRLSGTWRCAHAAGEPRIIALPGSGDAVVRYFLTTPSDVRVIARGWEIGDGAGLALGACAGQEPGYRAELRPAEGALRLLRRGQVVGECTIADASGDLELLREGPWIVARIGDEGVVWRDPEPLPDGHAEAAAIGGEVRLARLMLAGDSAHVYRFDRVEPDWRPASGEWTDHTGMACILWDYWITADGREEPALTWNRHPISADVAVDVSAAEFTEGHETGHHQHFPYHDLKIVLGGAPDEPDIGYAFIAGADGGRRSVLLRNGIAVASAENRRCRIVMGGHCNSPRAVRLRAQKSGGVLTLTFNGVEALRWEDPEPLGGGYVGLGCEGCRTIFRDCVIYPATGGPAS